MSCNKDTYLVTGGAGFIGSTFTELLAGLAGDRRIVVLDKLTYCGNLHNISHLIDAGKIEFVRGDIADAEAVGRIVYDLRPTYVVNFAAESHVDRSVQDPGPFVTTNIDGVYTLLEACRRQRVGQLNAGEEPTLRRFVQVSTDEVYGDMPVEAPRRAPEDICRAAGREVMCYGPRLFTEESGLHASSPYSASKASADMLAQAYHRSFGMPVCITRCSNNYGPRQFPEKLIPLMVNNILHGRELPVYGDGLNVRDWIHVADHSRGILAVLERGRDGEVYNFGAYDERTNIDMVKALIGIVRAEVEADAELAARYPAALGASEALIRYVGDRPGHDRRYAIDARKAADELGWRPATPFGEGLAETVRWYMANKKWVDDITGGEYMEYYEKMYAKR